METTCLCGAIRVKVDDDNLFGDNRRGHICHCQNCRKVSASVGGTNLIIETEKVTITGEGLKVYQDMATTSGKPLYRYFCGTCGNPIKSMTENFPGKTVLKLGIFPKIPTPAFETFTKDRQVWERPIEGCEQR